MHPKYSQRRKVSEINSDTPFIISGGSSYKMPFFTSLRNISERHKFSLPGGTSELKFPPFIGPKSGYNKKGFFL
jgi:hypothetical protein